MCEELPLEILTRIARVDLDVSRDMCCLGAFFCNEYHNLREKVFQQVNAEKLTIGNLKELELLHRHGYKMAREHVFRLMNSNNGAGTFVPVVLKFVARSQNFDLIDRALARAIKARSNDDMSNYFDPSFFGVNGRFNYKFYKQFISSLVREGYDLNTKDDQGIYCLAVDAVGVYCNYDLIKALGEHGCDLNLDGRCLSLFKSNFIHYKRYGNEKIYDILRMIGVSVKELERLFIQYRLPLPPQLIYDRDFPSLAKSKIKH